MLTLHQIFYNAFNKYQQDETIVFFSLLVLHCSQTFIDPDPEAVSRSFSILTLNLAQVNDGSFASYEHMISEDRFGLLDSALQLFKEILFSEKFQSALRRFLFHYGKSSKILEVNSFIKNELKIIFVKNGYFCGMCGRNGEIYLSRTEIERIMNISVFPDLNSVTESNAFIIGIGIHEFAHAILRKIILENELFFPSRGFYEPEKMEAGYKLEEMTFGTVLSDYKMVSRIDKRENWKFSGNELLSKEELEFQIKDSANFNKLFSGIYCIHKAIVFK